MEQKISVIIPNYNGHRLLAKNLPNVIKNCPSAEVIVVDDSSTDDSVDFLVKNFKSVRVITHTKNQGFAKSVNDGVAAASGGLVVLLNSDVRPQANFLKKVISYFADKTLFAVGFCDLSHENGKIVKRGRGGANFKRGFIEHFALAIKKGKTLWVSGGSGLFDKNKFLDLGGFNGSFAPFYWEDIDLSFRAWQTGYHCLFEPKSQVDHFHQEGAIKKSQSKFFIKTVAFKNQFLFVWKNISDPLLVVQHLLWLPYHFAKALLTLDMPFFIGFFWALSQVPLLIFNWKLEIVDWKLTDREVLKKFAKQ